VPSHFSDPALTICSQSAEFTDSAVETHFARHRLAQTKAQFHSSILFCAAFHVAFALTDVLALGASVETLLLFACRCAVAAVAVASCLSNRKYPHSVRRVYTAASLTEVAAMFGLVPLMLLRPADLHWHAMSIALMVLAVYVYIPNRYVWKVTIATVSSVIFVLIVLWLGRLSLEDMVSMTMLLVFANGFGCLAARRFHLSRREEFRVQLVLKNLSERDPLTGCHNRRYLQQELLNIELARGRRFRQSVSVIACDIDHFKAVNDTYGHAAGDLVLKSFAQLMRDMIRENVDSLIRNGGEEFLFVLPETDLAGATNLAERMRAALAQSTTQVALGQQIRVTASFGVTSVDYGSSLYHFPLEALLDLADELVYQAKHAGRDTVRARAFDPDNSTRNITPGMTGKFE
jgi:diguanylate cyclase (GGDEF)-like protein